MSKSGATAFVSVMLLAVGVVGFSLSVVWGKITGRDMDRDTILFLVKLWGGIVLVFLVLNFIV
jgi:predicted MFS family arabinose efflux permease